MINEIILSYLSMKNNEHACNRSWNVVTVSGTITVLPKERSNISGTVSVTPNFACPNYNIESSRDGDSTPPTMHHYKL